MKRTVTVDTSKDFLSFAGIIRANVTQQDIFFSHLALLMKLPWALAFSF